MVGESSESLPRHTEFLDRPGGRPRPRFTNDGGEELSKYFDVLALLLVGDVLVFLRGRPGPRFPVPSGGFSFRLLFFLPCV